MPYASSVAPIATSRDLPDDFAVDELVEMANLGETDTHIPGIIFISTALGSHGPRIKWYPGTPGRKSPCLIMSVGPDPQVRDDFLPSHVSRPVLADITHWVRQNQADLLTFWNEGETWDRHRVQRFLDGLKPIER